jgi:hypothetical protein
MANLPSAPIYITIEESQMGSVATESLAQAIGQSNNWIVDNSRSKPVGSVLYSILTEAQLQAIVGAGWILSDGRALLITDQFRIITGLTTAPDMRGTFQRAIAGVETITGSIVPGSNPAHTHPFILTNNVAKITGSSNDGVPPASGQQPKMTVDLSLSPGFLTIASSGGSEFAPKYIVTNIFLRIN